MNQVPIAGVFVTMPLALTSEMLRAVRQNPLTSCDDKDEENRRIGWLLCAWDVLIEHRQFAAGKAVTDSCEVTEAKRQEGEKA
jgi:hypothetical protein